MCPRSLHVKNQFRILKQLLIENATSAAMSSTDHVPTVRSEAKRL
jgi:hypothetical protein